MSSARRTESSSWTVVSDRKYTGSIKINYMLLTDAARGEAAREEDATYTYYDTTWLGMAEAYRDYLVGNGTLKKLENTEDDIPLYLEMFGALETKQTVMTIPVDMMTPLTTLLLLSPRRQQVTCSLWQSTVTVNLQLTTSTVPTQSWKIISK